MRKLFTIATFLGVGVLSLFGMSQKVFADTFFPQCGDVSVVNSPYFRCWINADHSGQFMDYRAFSGLYPDFSIPLNSTSTAVLDSFDIGTSTYFWNFYYGGNTYIYQLENGDTVNGNFIFNTRFISAVFSTTTGILDVSAYISPIDFASTTGVFYSYEEGYGTSLWSSGQHQATTSGLVSWSDYIVQPSTISSTTISSVTTISGSLWSSIVNSTCNPFNDIGCSSRYIYDSFSTSTDIGFYDPPKVRIYFAENCQPFSVWFDTGLCLDYLILPNQAFLASTTQKLYDGLLSKAPFGYLTHLVTLFQSSTTVALPTISYTFGTSSVFYGSIGDIHFDPWSSLDSLSSIVNTKSDQVVQKTLWDIMEIPINIVVYLTLLIIMIRDVTGLSGLAESEVASDIYEGKQNKMRKKRLWQRSVSSQVTNKRTFVP